MSLSFILSLKLPQSIQVFLDPRRAADGGAGGCAESERSLGLEPESNQNFKVSPMVLCIPGYII